MDTYTWYIHPLDDNTNEILSRELPEEDALRGQLCGDGKKRNLWRCKHEFITRLNKSGFRLRYQIFVQEGKGKIRPDRIPKRRKFKSLKTARDLMRKKGGS